MKAALLFGFAVACLIVDLPAAVAQEGDPFLHESYGMSQKLGGPEQMFYFVEFCRISRLQDAPWEKMSDVALMLFSPSSNEQNAESRVVFQKEGAACESYRDPMAALDLLSKIDFQRPSGKWLFQDSRYTAAETIFVNFLAAPSSDAVDRIAAAARYLGQTGQYPYRGIAKIISSAAVSRDQANMLLRDAVTFYEKESGFYNRDEEFLVLLRALKSSGFAKELTTGAAALLVQRLQQDPIRFPGEYYARFIASTGKVLSFTDRNKAFLFQAFPEIRRLNPQLASQLIRQDPKLRQATDHMSYIVGGFVSGDPTTEQAVRQRLQWLQESLLNRIRECQRCTPETLEHLASRVSDPSLRIVGFSAAIRGFARTRPSRARRIFKDQLSALDNLSDSVGKLGARVALASAAYHIGDSKRYEDLSAEAFDRGVQFFNADLGGKRAARREGFNELRELVLFTASQPGDILRTKVDRLPEGWLKTYLCLYEAHGHGRVRNSGRAARTKHR